MIISCDAFLEVWTFIKIVLLLKNATAVEIFFHLELLETSFNSLSCQVHERAVMVEREISNALPVPRKFMFF